MAWNDHRQRIAFHRLADGAAKRGRSTKFFRDPAIGSRLAIRDAAACVPDSHLKGRAERGLDAFGGAFIAINCARSCTKHALGFSARCARPCGISFTAAHRPLKQQRSILALIRHERSPRGCERSERSGFARVRHWRKAYPRKRRTPASALSSFL